MPVDGFEARLARVRHRFAGSLESKINDTVSEFSRLSEDAPDAQTNVDQVYRRIHGICGVAATVGFGATGRAAREAEVVLLVPARARRGLTPSESAVFKGALGALLKAAQQELQMMYARGG